LTPDPHPRRPRVPSRPATGAVCRADPAPGDERAGGTADPALPAGPRQRHRELLAATAPSAAPASGRHLLFRLGRRPVELRSHPEQDRSVGGAAGSPPRRLGGAPARRSLSLAWRQGACSGLGRRRDVLVEAGITPHRAGRSSTVGLLDGSLCVTTTTS
jgi:hypothetical protein